MKRFPVNHKLRGTAALTALLLSSSLTAGQIDSVCKTDDQTLNGIKSDPDPTLWIFMQTVCQGQFVITQTPASPQPLATTPPTPEVTPLVTEVAEIPFEKVDSLSKSVQSPYPYGIGTKHSRELAVTARTENKHLPKRNSMEVGTQSRETGVQTVSLAKKEKNPEQAIVEVVAKVELDKTAPNQGMHEAPTSEGSDVQVSEVRETKDKGYRSKRPWLYSLLGPQVSPPVIETLPPPIEYEPSRFSNYKPVDIGQVTASNRGKGHLQKPDIMSITPHGFFTSLYWHSYDEPNVMKQGGPSVGIGYVDERAVREWESYPGLGSRFEVGQGWVEYEGSGKTTNRTYYGLAEIYAPVSSGFFVGIGLRRYVDDKVPEDLPYGWGVLTSSGARAYDRISDYFYLPFGFAGAGANGSTYKVQFNYLIEGRQTSKLTQTYIADDLQNIQKDGWGLDISYSPSLKSEVFLRFWDIKKSDERKLTVNGLQTGYFGYEPANTTLEIGARRFW